MLQNTIYDEHRYEMLCYAFIMLIMLYVINMINSVMLCYTLERELTSEVEQYGATENHLYYTFERELTSEIEQYGAAEHHLFYTLERELTS